MNKNTFLVIALLLATTVCAHAQRPAPTVDMLVADLASGDDGPRQARARQLLPLQGAEVVEKVIPLLDDERDAVYFTTLRVLEDTLHERLLLQDKAARERVAEAILSLTAPEASDRRKAAGLRLLPYVVEAHHSLVNVAALLRDASWQEPARAALETIPTQNALTVLCNALGQADSVFKVDLLRSIAAFDPGDEIRKVLPLLEDASAPVRGAALRALARTANPELIPHARRICASADEESAFDAWDGWLRLADAMAIRGGLWEQAMSSYQEILKTAPHTLVQSGAITGMGRFGDDTAIPPILAALAGDNGASLEPAALEAFRNLDGRDVRNALAAAFPALGATMQVGLLALFGDAGAPEYMTILAACATHEDSAIRRTALNALGKSSSPEAAPLFRNLLEETFQKGSAYSDERDTVLAGLHALAQRMDHAKDKTGAGSAWLTLYEHAEDETLRETALNGIRRNPVPEAFDVVLDLLAAGDIESLPVDAMIGIAHNAIAAGRTEEGQKLMDEILPRLTTSDAVRRAAHAMRVEGPNPEFARLIGVVNRWHFIGPFFWNPGTGFEPTFFGEPEVNLDAVYNVDGHELKWRVVESDDVVGVYNLSAVIENVENAVAFAFVRIQVEAGGPAQVRAGSDDGIRVWVNGDVVLEKDVDRGYDIDQDIADIELKPGMNELLVQITQRAGGWAFCLRLTHPDGRPLHYQLAP